ncbi:hypothetical protein [Paenibacillus lutrae]|uniref:Uncharacterized protein n=1 Tax=Paenibacillus lutrae TaxID=2078573 RepID=A0A7X3FJH8_9BACL|nr:hypothetical protein [Paenibacillus lutrae]MVP00467.1 hypothetical protein [Paenibacillus lutrae]
MFRKTTVLSLAVVFGVLSAGSSALAANEYASVSANREYPKYTDAVNGQHQYGRYTVTMTDGIGGILGTLQEKCGSTWVDRDSVEVNTTSDSTTDTDNYYMAGGCQYRVKLTVGASGGTAYIRNWN